MLRDLPKKSLYFYKENNCKIRIQIKLECSHK